MDLRSNISDLCFSSQFHFFCIVMERTKICHCIFFQGYRFIGSHFEFGLVQIGLDLYLYWIAGYTVFLEDPKFLVCFFQTKDLVSRFIRIAAFSTIIDDLVQLCADIDSLIFHAGNQAFGFILCPFIVIG